MARHPRWVLGFVSAADLDAVAEAIAAAESTTSAEIRVHLDERVPGDPPVDAMSRAVEVFERLGMHRTAARNGVLIYVSTEDHRLAVIGDRAIHERVGQVYWERLVDAVLAHFRAQRPRDGLVHAVSEVGALLRRHFPRGPDDVNELSDQVSIGP